MGKQKYKIKNTVVQAFRVGYDEEILDLLKKNRQIIELRGSCSTNMELEIESPLGCITLYKGDYIILENNSLIYGCPYLIFKEKYEKLEE